MSPTQEYCQLVSEFNLNDYQVAQTLGVTLPKLTELVSNNELSEDQLKQIKNLVE